MQMCASHVVTNSLESKQHVMQTVSVLPAFQDLLKSYPLPPAAVVFACINIVHVSGFADKQVAIQVHHVILQKSRRPCAQFTPSPTTLIIASHLLDLNLRVTLKKLLLKQMPS